MSLTTDQMIVAAILASTLILLVWNVFRFDVVAVIVLCLLVGTGSLTPQHALQGFANEAIVVLACLFVITRSLQKTGFADTAGFLLQRLVGTVEWRIYGLLLAVVGTFSAIINNTAVTAMAIPMVVRCYDRLGRDPGGVYLPLAYMSLVGGTMTLIGTSTNLVVNAELRREEIDLPPLSMFEMAPLGLVFTAVSGVTLLLCSRFFLRRDAKVSLFRKYNVREFLSEILVKAESAVVGRPIQELHFGHDYDITIIGVVRNGKTIFSPSPSMAIHEDDVLMVQGGVENIISLRKEKRVELLNEITVVEGTLRSIDLVMAEVVLLPNSDFSGQTIRDIDLRDAYGVTILALSRRGLKHISNLADIPLQLGDTLLIQGHPSGIERLRRSPNLLVLGTIDRPLTNHRLPIALTIVAAMVIASSIPGSVLFLNCLLAVLALLATRCISLSDVYESIDWRILVLAGGLLPLGRAIDNADLLDPIVAMLPFHQPWACLALLYLLTFAITQVISNLAAAALMVPVAVQAAERLDVHHRPFVMAVAFAASFAFLTPVGHQSCTLVMGPGNYALKHYLGLGLFLGVILFVAAVFGIPWAFPFVPG